MILDLREKTYNTSLAIPISSILAFYGSGENTTMITTDWKNYEVKGSYEEILKQYKDEIYCYDRMITIR